MGQHLDRLKDRLTEVHHLHKANALLKWDLETYMPVGGSSARAEQMSTLSRLAHNLFTSAETGTLLERAAAETASMSDDTDDACLVRVASRDYERARRLPGSLVAELSRHVALAREIWVQARKHGDFASFAPYLTRGLELNRERAEHLGYDENVYDPLLDVYEQGMKASDVSRIFADLKSGLRPLVAAIADRDAAVDDSVVHQRFEESGQETVGKRMAAVLGYDFQRGRLDLTVHPFETSFSRNDVRITTRYEPNFLLTGLFGCMHEAGHAMYEQGVAQELDSTLLGRGVSSSFHESQSRMWENVVGRSLRFWQCYYRDLQQVFPAQLGNTGPEQFYRAINRVHPSFIRVEADEVTYNLHVMVRFEMELELLGGEYPVAEAPDSWNHKMEQYLGVTPPNDSAGILQDTHWSSGLFGYFPTYALGNVLSVQLYDTALQEQPSIDDELESGITTGLREWMAHHVYRHGRKFAPADLVVRATGRPLETGPYLAYLNKKFGALYGLPTPVS